MILGGVGQARRPDAELDGMDGNVVEDVESVQLGPRKAHVRVGRSGHVNEAQRFSILVKHCVNHSGCHIIGPNSHSVHGGKEWLVTLDTIDGRYVDIAVGVHFDAIRDGKVRAVVARNRGEEVSVSQSAAIDHIKHSDGVRLLDVHTQAGSADQTRSSR